MKRILLLALAVLMGPLASAFTGDQGNEAAVAQVIAEARADCSDYRDGELILPDKPWPEIDLTHDGRMATIVDAHEFHCTTAATLWCGTGGCPVTVIIGGEPHEFMAKGWKVVDWSNIRVLLLEVHGSECGGTNLRKCVRAEVWSDGAFRSVDQK